MGPELRLDAPVRRLDAVGAVRGAAFAVCTLSFRWVLSQGLRTVPISGRTAFRFPSLGRAATVPSQPGDGNVVCIQDPQLLFAAKRVAHVGVRLLSALRAKNLDDVEPVRFVVARAGGEGKASAGMDANGHRTVTIDSSLIEKVGPKDDTLAFVLAHELTHLLARHVEERWTLRALCVMGATAISFAAERFLRTRAFPPRLHLYNRHGSLRHVWLPAENRVASTFTPELLGRTRVQDDALEYAVVLDDACCPLAIVRKVTLGGDSRLMLVPLEGSFENNDWSLLHQLPPEMLLRFGRHVEHRAIALLRSGRGSDSSAAGTGGRTLPVRWCMHALRMVGVQVLSLNVLHCVVLTPHTRRCELEADLIGATVAQAAGYDARAGASTMFALMHDTAEASRAPEPEPASPWQVSHSSCSQPLIRHLMDSSEVAMKSAKELWQTHPAPLSRLQWVLHELQKQQTMRRPGGHVLTRLPYWV